MSKGYILRDTKGEFFPIYRNGKHWYCADTMTPVARRFMPGVEGRVYWRDGNPDNLRPENVTDDPRKVVKRAHRAALAAIGAGGCRKVGNAVWRGLDVICDDYDALASTGLITGVDPVTVTIDLTPPRMMQRIEIVVFSDEAEHVANRYGPRRLSA